MKRTFISFMVLSLMSVQVFAQVNILSGPKKSTYDRLISDMERVFNGDSAEVVKNYTTKGAAYNYQRLLQEDSPFDVAILPIDFLLHQKLIELNMNTDETKNIKILLPMGWEQIHLLAKKNKEFSTLMDTKGAIVDIGGEQQSTFGTLFYINERAEMDWSMRNFHIDKGVEKLFMDEIDVLAFVGTSPVEKLNFPNQSLKEDFVMLSVTNENEWAKNYKEDVIHADDYSWLEEDVPTYSVQTVLVVNEAKLTDENKEDLKKLVELIRQSKVQLKEGGHPSWEDIDFYTWDEKLWPMLKLE